MDRPLQVISSRVQQPDCLDVCVYKDSLGVVKTSICQIMTSCDMVCVYKLVRLQASGVTLTGSAKY